MFQSLVLVVAKFVLCSKPQPSHSIRTIVIYSTVKTSRIIPVRERCLKSTIRFRRAASDSAPHLDEFIAGWKLIFQAGAGSKNIMIKREE